MDIPADGAAILVGTDGHCLARVPMADGKPFCIFTGETFHLSKWWCAPSEEAAKAIAPDATVHRYDGTFEHIKVRDGRCQRPEDPA